MHSREKVFIPEKKEEEKQDKHKIHKPVCFKFFVCLQKIKYVR